MNKQQPITKTVVTYTKNGVRYEHVFSEVLALPQVEQRLLLEKHVPAHDVLHLGWR